MTVKKQINKLAKAYRKKANCGFIESFTLAKWMFHKAEWEDVVKVKGFTYLYDYDDMHLVDYSRYFINDVDMSGIYRDTFIKSNN